MTRRHFLAAMDPDKIEGAIAAVESRSSLEVRVAVAGLFWGNPRRVAERTFARLGMTATKGGTGVLLFVAPWRRRIVVLADRGVNAVVDADYWDRLVGAVTSAFRERRYTDAVVDAIQTLGRDLAPLFPPDAAGNPNELPNAIS